DLSPIIEARLWDEDDIRNLGVMCDEVHAQGGLAGVELWYGGVHTINTENRDVTRGASQLSSDVVGPWHYCSAMSRREIREVQGWYVTAAKRAADAGFDVINVYGGHGYAVTQQFLM